jgi:hypothetical protein
LLVIAWGHGGRQGANAVLHVRGPRLTPADFTKVAAELPASQSRWILLFRGSGEFAKQLSGANREILSSELDSSFSSDPIGMSVLLKLLRSNDSATFATLVEAFGHDTAAWYEERHLARTEEPTLWLPNEKPRPLAAVTSEIASTDSKAKALSEAIPEVKPGGSNQPPTKPLEPQTVSRELPAVWKEIKKVDPQKYPEADGVILRQRLNCTLGSNPALVTEQEEFLQILTPEGKQFGDFDVSFSPPYEEVEFEDCEVLQPGGEVARLDPDAINESHDRAVGDYQAARRKFFSLPGVVPGSVLHVRYRTQWKDFPLPKISMEMPLGQELVTLDSTVQVSVPKEDSFHFAFADLAAPDPTIKQSGYSTTYGWHFDRVPAAGREVLEPPHRKARLLISTFPDWRAFADWYGRISQLTDEVTPEITTKAQELTRDAKDERGKVLAVYNYVSGLRYVAIPLGVNSLRPHAAANVLRNQFGDCKDKANLLNALLHALEIRAHLVLVPRFSQAYDAVPGLAFNHAISRVTLGSEVLWVDTTDDVCRFGLLPPGDPGRKVLVIDGERPALCQLPTPEPKDHRLTLRGVLACSSLNNTLPVKLEAVTSGYSDYEMREAAREAKERRGSLPLLAVRFRPASGSFALEKQKSTAVSALTEDFSWQAEGTCVGLASAAAGTRLLRPPFWLPKEWDLALHARRAPLFLNQGYPLKLEQEFEVLLPAQSRVSLPEARENKEEPLRWRIQWAKLSDDKLSVSLHAELARGELSPEETTAVQGQVRELLAAMDAPATIMP